MRSLTAAFAALASLLVLGSARAVDVPAGIANTMWECEGTAAVQYSVKGGGTLKSRGVYSTAPCDIWGDEVAGQVFVGMHDLTFPDLPDGEDSVMGYLILDPGVFKTSSVKVGIVKPETRAVIGQLAADVWTLLTGYEGVVDGEAMLAVTGADPARFGDLLIDPATIRASGQFVATKKVTEVHATVTIHFEGVLTSGALDGRAVKGKIVVKVKGVPSMMPGK